MKWISLLLFLSGMLSLWREFNPINVYRFNKLVDEGTQNYKDSSYENSALNWEAALKHTQKTNDELSLNLGNAYFNLQDTSKSKKLYLNASISRSKPLASRSQSQLGVLSAIANQKDQALENFKQALRDDPTNHEARFNYEVLKKMKEMEEQQSKPNKNQTGQQNKKEKSNDEKKPGNSNDEQSGEPQNSNKKDKGFSENEKEDRDNIGKELNRPDLEKMQKMGLNEKRAAQLLENLRSRENEFIQQQPKKATKPNKNKGNDW